MWLGRQCGQVQWAACLQALCQMLLVLLIARNVDHASWEPDSVISADPLNRINLGQCLCQIQLNSMMYSMIDQHDEQ